MRPPKTPFELVQRWPLPPPLPAAMRNRIAAQLLGRIFAGPIGDGELDFLEGHALCVELRELSWTANLRFERRQILSARAGECDLWVQGGGFDFLSLLTGREDPDTLFFQRRLRMQGDTALGVHLKHFLAALEPERLPAARWILPGLGAAFELARPRPFDSEKNG